FRAEDLDLTFVHFEAAARMVAPLSTGELDVSAGAASAGFYNAATRGIKVKIAAGFSRTVPNNPYYALVVRKELVASSAFKGLPDLKGKKAALNAPGVSAASVLAEAARAGGVSYDDIEKVFLGFSQQIAAFRNKAIDVSLMVEPFVTASVDAGV